jgi:phospholipid/cholesterol/gamma-HCH transport system permease protein
LRLAGEQLAKAHRARGPVARCFGHLYRIGATALPITALVGFLIGVVLAYLMAQQLRQFGADAFIVNMLGIALIRELGPLLAAILLAGRSGSAITAQIGVMRVTEELDAMRVMGIPAGLPAGAAARDGAGDRHAAGHGLDHAVRRCWAACWRPTHAMGITPAYFLSACPRRWRCPT